MRWYVEVESSNLTGNWAYVVRDGLERRRVLATGDRNLAYGHCKKLNSGDDPEEGGDWS